jgi:endo-1,4-beta-xylanase
VKRILRLILPAILITLLAACGATGPGSAGVALPLLLPSAAPTLVSRATPTITATPRPAPVPTLAQSLRGAAFNRNILIGSAVDQDHIRRDPQYASTLGREFSAFTPENALKFGPLEPTRGTFKFDDADFLVNFAEANGMQVRGHTLVWHNELPQWLIGGKFSRDELIAIMHEHISTVVGRYRGRVYAWDVVNEAIDDQTGQLRETIWSMGIGPDYIDMAFRFAREADPNAKLIYNDYGDEGLGGKSDAIYALVKGMKGRGVPIDGVGLQSHFPLDGLPQAADVDANMKRLGALGLQVQITELDIRMAVPATGANLQRQADEYREYLQKCLANSNCTTFVMWGFTDKYSWIPSRYPGKGAAFIFDEQYQPKPAYRALQDVLEGK